MLTAGCFPFVLFFVFTPFAVTVFPDCSTLVLGASLFSGVCLVVVVLRVLSGGGSSSSEESVESCGRGGGLKGSSCVIPVFRGDTSIAIGTVVPGVRWIEVEGGVSFAG